VTTADEDRIAARRAEAIKLRVRGKTMREIAAELGVGLATAHDDVRRMMTETAQEAEGNVQAQRGLELLRLERALQVIESVLANSEGADGGDELQLKTLDRLVKIQDQRAKLLGLYAPERKEVDARVAAVELDELDALKAAALANVCSDSAPKPSEADESEPSS
jgi:transposase